MLQWSLGFLALHTCFVPDAHLFVATVPHRTSATFSAWFVLMLGCASPWMVSKTTSSKCVSLDRPCRPAAAGFHVQVGIYNCIVMAVKTCPVGCYEYVAQGREELEIRQVVGSIMPT